MSADTNELVERWLTALVFALYNYPAMTTVSPLQVPNVCFILLSKFSFVRQTLGWQPI
jgi:hypothetical protein